MIRTLSKRFMTKLELESLQLETGRDPAPTRTPLAFYCVTDTTTNTGEPLAAVFEVPPGTVAQEIEQSLMAQLTRDGIV